jgi:hypothetical protein
LAPEHTQNFNRALIPKENRNSTLVKFKSLSFFIECINLETGTRVVKIYITENNNNNNKSSSRHG